MRQSEQRRAAERVWGKRVEYDVILIIVTNFMYKIIAE